MKIAFLTESRADWGGVFPCLIEAIRPGMEVELWITGEHLRRGTAIDVVKELGSLNVGGQVEKKFFPDSKQITQKDIDWLVVHGDREEVLYAVIAAWKQGIKIAHISGGDKQGGRLIDEPVRDCISHFASIHFPSLQTSADRLRAIGTPENDIHFVGSPFVTHLVNFKPVKKDYNEYYLVQFHPGPNWVEDMWVTLRKIELLIAYHNGDTPEGRLPIKFLEPNWDEGPSDLREEFPNRGIIIVPSLPRQDFLQLLWNAQCFIGNSSALFLEAQYLGVPCLHVGERNKGREEAFRGHVTHCGDEYSFKPSLMSAISKDARRTEGLRANWKQGAHGDGSAARKIIEILEGVEVKCR